MNSVSGLYVQKIQTTDFYIHGSVYRNSILIRSNKMQQYAGIYLLQNFSTSGVHKTVTAASGTGHTTYLSNKLPPTWLYFVGFY